MALLQAATLAITTLASDYTSGDSTLTLTDGSRFPTSGGRISITKSGSTNIWIYIYTSRSSNTLSGVSFSLDLDGTGDANHGSGSTAKVADDAQYLNQFRDLFTSSDLLKQENGGIEADISAVVQGDLIVGSGTGTMALLSPTHADGAFLVSDGNTWTLEAAATALASMGAAEDGANSNITSMTGLTGAIEAPTKINDTNSNEVLEFGATASAVNHWKFTNEATGNAPALAVVGGDTNADGTIDAKGTGDLLLQTSATNNVGIGTASPGSLLELGISSGDPAITFDIGGTDKFTLGVDDDDSDSLKIASSGALGSSDRVTLLSSGELGVGTTSPAELLEVSGSDNIYAQVTTTGANSTVGLKLADDAQTFSLRVDGDDSDNFQIYDDTNTATRLVVDTSGNIGVGTNSPIGLFHVAGAGIYVDEISAPSTPTSGSGVLYGKSDGKLYFKNDAGTETELTQTLVGATSVTISPTSSLALQIDPFGSSSGNTGEFRLLELAANGTNYTGLKAPDSLAANVIYTLPTADGSSGQFLSTNGSGTLSWTGAGGGAGLSNIVEDNSPQLGGQLDVNGNALGDGTAELLKFSEASSAVNEITISNAAIGSAPGIAATGDDTNINLTIDAKGTGDLILQNTATGKVIFGGTTSTSEFLMQREGTAKANTVFLEITNTVNDVDMDTTGTSIDFRQYYNDASPAADDAARIQSITETDWTATASTRSSALTFWTSNQSTLEEQVRITSAGLVGIGTAAPASQLHIVPDNAAALQIDPFGASAGNTGEIRFLELAANGTSYIGFKAPDSITTSTIFELPDGDGTSGQVLITNASGVLSWSSPGISNVVSDTTPQLGGQLDVNGQCLGDGTNELLCFSEAGGSAVNEITVGNATTGNGPTLAATGDDTNINLEIDAKGTGDLLLNSTATGNVGIGTSTPGSTLTVEDEGTAKANKDFLRIINTVNAADMDGTSTSITFAQYYNDASPAAQNAARLLVGTETDWNATDTTKDAFFDIMVSENASVDTKLRITSAGLFGFNTTSPASAIHIVPTSAAAFQIDPFGTGGGQTGEFRLLELAASGTNYVGLKAPDALSGNQIWVLPTNDGSNGQNLVTDGSGNLSWSSSGGGGISNVSDDTSPTLGGDLDVDAFSIVKGSDELIKFSDVTSAVNEITVANAATGNNPAVAATGDDTNITLAINGKGSGSVTINGGAIDQNGILQTHVGTETLWLPARYWQPTVSNGCSGLTVVETTAGRPDIEVLDFDATADEHAQCSIALPKRWDEGTITFQVWWTSTATDTDGVAWALQGVAVSDGDTIDVAYGTAVAVTDNAQSTAEDCYVTSVSSAITIAGTPAEGDVVYLRLLRDVSDGNDDMTEDARLVGIKLFWTSDAGNDD